MYRPELRKIIAHFEWEKKKRIIFSLYLCQNSYNIHKNTFAILTTDNASHYKAPDII